MERTQCKRGHPLDETNTYRLRRGGGRIETRCRKCYADASTTSRERHKERINQQARDRAAAVDKKAPMPLCGCGNGKQIMPSTLKIADGSGNCSTCHYRRIKKWRDANPDKAREIRNRARKRLVDEFVEAYGGGCGCCGEDQPAFLTLDHVNGDGGGRNRGQATARIFRQLRAAGWPQDPRYRLLCFNCNSGRHRNGGTCPHQTTEKEPPP